MKKVKLTYFKESGKYYTEGQYTSMFDFDFMIYKEVETFNGTRRMPGLSTTSWHGYILVEAVNGVPGLIDLTRKDTNNENQVPSNAS